MGVIDILETGRQGLVADRTALQTTSTNIANANTPGYSRQRTELAALPPTVEGRNRSGNGVEVRQVVRMHDDFLQNQLVEQNRSLGNFRSRAEGLAKVEAVVHNEGERVNNLLNGFFNNLRDLSANPEVATLRNSVASSADAVANGFHSMNEQLNSIKRTLDQTLDAHIEGVNSTTRQIANLNKMILDRQNRGEVPNELLDQREMAVRDLSTKLGVESIQDDKGNLNVTCAGVGALVIGDQSNELITVSTPAKGDKTAGSVDICLKDPFGVRVLTHGIKEGEIGGLVHVRDEVINGSLKKLDQLAYRFTHSVNSVHREGVGADGEGERDLFKHLDDVDNASRLIGMSDEVKNRPEAIAAALEPGKAGDNRIALKLADLQSMKIDGVGEGAAGEAADGHLQTFNESLSNLVGDIGVKAHEDSESLEHQEAIVNQLENYRQTVSGVSLEEEAVNMMKFQSSFNACAKAMKVGDELLQTVLSLRP